MHEINQLIDLGLTPGEAKVYLALLELGSTKVGPVVKKSEVAQSNVYWILERLKEKGLVSYTVKSKIKYFQAASPKFLLEYLQNKQKALAEQEKLLHSFLPKLLAIEEQSPKQEVEVFTGTKGLRSAYEKLLEEGEELLHFYEHKKEYAKVSDLFYFNIMDILKKVPAKGIVNKAYKSSSVIKKANFVSYRFVSFPIPGNIEFCADKVLIISWKKPIVGILIHSESIVGSLKTYFNAVWRQAKDL